MDALRERLRAVPGMERLLPLLRALPPIHLVGGAVRDLFGGHGFVDVGEDATTTLTLGSRGFYWLGLTPATEES